MLEGLFSILGTTFSLILQWWWVPAPIVLFIVFNSLWLRYRRIEYMRNIPWVLLRISVPLDVVKTPLAMEQVFANLHSIQVEGTWYEQNIGGKVQEWFSLELISISGDIYFFIRTPQKFRNLVESAIYAQYPEAEIAEYEDYVSNVPAVLPNAETDIFGSEFKLMEADGYPIRTYEHFIFDTEEGAGNVDPLAHIVEALSRIRHGEQVWLQIEILPVDKSWKDSAEELIEEILGRKEKTKEGPGVLGILTEEVGAYLSNAPMAPFEGVDFGAAAQEGKKEERVERKIPAFHETERVKEISRKLSKVAFKTAIRGLYIAPKEIFDIPTYFSVVGGFRQFTAQDLNGLRPAEITGGKWPFKKAKTRVAKKQHLMRYRIRLSPSKGFILNIEELASIFHFPGKIVTSPALPRVETKKGEPPTGLPVL